MEAGDQAGAKGAGGRFGSRWAPASPACSLAATAHEHQAEIQRALRCRHYH